MLSVLWLAFGSLLRILRNRRDLIFENFVLRQQLTVLKPRRPRPALNPFDKPCGLPSVGCGGRLPELMLLTPRRHACPDPQYIASHRFAACWNGRPEYVASRIPTQFGLRPAVFIGRAYPVSQGLNFGKAQE